MEDFYLTQAINLFFAALRENWNDVLHAEDSTSLSCALESFAISLKYLKNLPQWFDAAKAAPQQTKDLIHYYTGPIDKTILFEKPPTKIVWGFLSDEDQMILEQIFIMAVRFGDSATVRFFIQQGFQISPRHLHDAITGPDPLNYLQGGFVQDPTLEIDPQRLRYFDPDQHAAFNIRQLHFAARFMQRHGCFVPDRNGVIRILLDNGIAVDQRDRNGLTPLMKAAASHHLSAMETLLAAKADVTLCDNAGKTALSRALTQWKQTGSNPARMLPAVTLLYQYRAIPNLANLIEAINCDNTEVLALTRARTKDREIPDPRNWSLLPHALHSPAAVKKLLESKDTLHGVDFTDPKRQLFVVEKLFANRLVMDEEFTNDIEKRDQILSMLLVAGFDPNLQDDQGFSLLMRVTNAHHGLQAARLFFSNNTVPCQVNLQNKQGDTALSLLIRAGLQSNRHLNDQAPDLVAAASFLLEQKADPTLAATDSAETALTLWITYIYKLLGEYASKDSINSALRLLQKLCVDPELVNASVALQQLFQTGEYPEFISKLGLLITSITSTITSAHITAAHFEVTQNDLAYYSTEQTFEKLFSGQEFDLGQLMNLALQDELLHVFKWVFKTVASEAPQELQESQQMLELYVGILDRAVRANKIRLAKFLVETYQTPIDRAFVVAIQHAPSIALYFLDRGQTASLFQVHTAIQKSDSPEGLALAQRCLQIYLTSGGAITGLTPEPDWDTLLHEAVRARSFAMVQLICDKAIEQKFDTTPTIVTCLQQRDNNDHTALHCALSLQPTMMSGDVVPIARFLLQQHLRYDVPIDIEEKRAEEKQTTAAPPSTALTQAANNPAMVTLLPNLLANATILRGLKNPNTAYTWFATAMPHIMRNPDITTEVLQRLSDDFELDVLDPREYKQDCLVEQMCTERNVEKNRLEKTEVLIRAHHRQHYQLPHQIFSACTTLGLPNVITLVIISFFIPDAKKATHHLIECWKTNGIPGHVVNVAAEPALPAAAAHDTVVNPSLRLK